MSRKKRLPYIPLFVDDYHRDTRHLSTEEHGAYLLLIMAAWASPSASLPDDDHVLAGLAKVTPSKWKKIKPVVMAFWNFDGRSKKWVQKRLKKERGLAVDRSNKSGDAAASRWNTTKKGDAKSMPDGCHPFKAFKEKPNGFSKRASAQKPSGFVEVRKTTHAINDLIEEIRNDATRIGIGREGHGSDVPVLPAIRAGRP